nr:winged helix-turn-helix domain-containing protein [Archaeoglobus neptunius]
MAIANSTRRKILEELSKSPRKVEELRAELGLDVKLLKYHLDTLEKADCIVYDGESIRLTKEGEVLAKLVQR